MGDVLSFHDGLARWKQRQANAADKPERDRRLATPQPRRPTLAEIMDGPPPPDAA